VRAPRPPTLEVEDLHVRAGAVDIVRGISFALAPGERVGLIGESGSGKSITALAVMGLLPEELTSSGVVCMDGANLLGRPDRELAGLRGDRLTMVFQEPMSSLNPLMRVGRQVGEVLRVHRGLGRADADRRAVELLTRVELPDPAHAARAYPHQLSGGQRQRVMLAMALACDPAVLICDEPTTALDVTVQARMLGLIDRLVAEEHSALLFITHDLAVVSGLCERVLVMYGGTIVESGPTRAVFARPRHHYTAGLLASSIATTDDSWQRDGDRLPTIAGTVPAAGSFPTGCVFRTRCPRADEQCERMPTLEGDDHRAACWHPPEAAS
jgi:oligopeptide/dipeptide ABC transporter ATP-binding protein